MQFYELSGKISNYNSQTLYLFKCHEDTLLLVDSTKTDLQGEFIFKQSLRLTQKTYYSQWGLYKIVLQHNQSFQILFNESAVKIETVYKPDFFYNIATDSLKVLQSEDNMHFFEFQQLQQQVNVANYYLLQMMRLYPIPDPFHKQIEEEYYKRFDFLTQFVNRQLNDKPESMATKIAMAYYLPILPDWKQPDPFRDSIIALHFFDYFNPADSFYMHTNILPEKIDWYLTLRTNKRDDYGQPVFSEDTLTKAAIEFLENIKIVKTFNKKAFDFTLTYLLKRFLKENKHIAFMRLYDKYLYREGESCEIENDNFKVFREHASSLRNVQIGSVAPDFEIGNNSGLFLHNLKSDYFLLIFWASWCPHCKDELVKIKNLLDEKQPLFKQKEKNITTIAISLDTDKKQWQDFIKNNNLSTWIQTAELKGWEGKIIKQYNVYATPTMILLDKNKKIILLPMDWIQLKKYLEEKNIVK